MKIFPQVFFNSFGFCRRFYNDEIFTHLIKDVWLREDKTKSTSQEIVSAVFAFFFIASMLM